MIYVRGNARVQVQKRKSEYGGNKYFLYIPKSLESKLRISAGDIVDFDMENLGQDENPRRFKPFTKSEGQGNSQREIVNSEETSLTPK